ncbi:probable RNA-binding protein 18 [Parasteatoda tepidariorum]|uniref:probable RNA-binding protein 18 n=1 Tax=Parasteatoda tepidariorum TaxID=114398 RepID=UPI001C71954C|nr:probable RNA-binding protein 18 [Parasteatoda tepidariorum]
MSIEASIPLPLDPSPPPEADEKRLWIGNIDSRLTEYNLLKIVQQFGKIKKFDFLFHKSGHLKGHPRGYCFVTYDRREEAEKAMINLNGKLFMGKELAVKWAHTAPSDSVTQQKSTKTICDTQPDESKKSKSSLHQIMAIEAKLKAMKEQRERELEMCLSPATVTADNPSKQSHKKHHNVPYHVEKRRHRR